jgi:hypothetical protein
MKRLLFVVVLIVAGLTRFDDPSRAQTSGAAAAEGTTRAVAAANAFLATLTPAQRSAALLELRPDLRARWSNLPSGTVMQVDREKTKTPLPRNGVKMGDLNAKQQDAVHALLKATLSADGYQKAIDIVNSDEEQERRAAPGRPATSAVKFGRAEYFVAILGNPSPTSPWMLQFGGHHLAINLTFAGANRVMTPSHLGAQPAYFSFESRTVRPLGDEHDKAVALINALDEKQRQQAMLGSTMADTVLAAGSDGQVIQPEGVRVSTFTPAQREQLLGLIGEWVTVADATAAAARMKEIAGALGETWFAWSCPTTKEGGAYFRIQGPTLVIEYAPQALKSRGPDGTPEHIHTIYRDPTNDYGRKFSGQ